MAVAIGSGDSVATAVSPDDEATLLEGTDGAVDVRRVLREPPASRAWALVVEGDEHLVGTGAVARVRACCRVSLDGAPWSRATEQRQDHP